MREQRVLDSGPGRFGGEVVRRGVPLAPRTDEARLNKRDDVGVGLILEGHQIALQPQIAGHRFGDGLLRRLGLETAGEVVWCDDESMLDAMNAPAKG